MDVNMYKKMKYNITFTNATGTFSFYLAWRITNIATVQLIEVMSFKCSVFGIHINVNYEQKWTMCTSSHKLQHL
jgi:hypothetical protein